MPRERVPLDVHSLKGTQAKYTQEPAIEGSRPKFPSGLKGEGKKIFKRLAAILERRHVLTEGEVELLRLYAILSVRHAKALEHIELEGEVCKYSRLNNRGEEVLTEKPNLWLAIAESAEKNMVAILDRLGLSPLNRSKVKATSPAEKKKEPAKPGTTRWYMEHSAEEIAAMTTDEEEESIQ